MTNAESPQQNAILTINQALQQAIAHHHANRLQDASTAPSCKRGLNGEAVEALAGRLEGGAEIAAQSNTDQPTSRKQRDPSPQEINALVV